MWNWRTRDSRATARGCLGLGLWIEPLLIELLVFQLGLVAQNARIEYFTTVRAGLFIERLTATDVLGVVLF
jgi:hypothetical protein